MARRATNALTITEGANTILDIQPTQDPALSAALVGMRASIERAAQHNVEMAIAESGGGTYTDLELVSMVTIESLKQVGGLELTAILLRAMYLRMIQQGNMIANHPGQYTSLKDMAEDNGISTAELSQTLDMVNYVFPYCQTELGIPVAQLWELLGKSKLREITPIIKMMVSGEGSNTGTTRQSVERLMEDGAATFLASAQGEQYRNLDNIEDEELRMRLQHELDEIIRRNTIAEVVEVATVLPNERLRTHLRPDRTPLIPVTVINDDGTHTVLAKMDNDQFLLWQRFMGTHVEQQGWDVPDDDRQRQIEAARIAEIRYLMGLLRGQA